jgi:hypothetical protein
MKLLGLLAVLAGVLATAAIAGYGNPLVTGSFSTKISGKARALNGTWTLRLKSTGRFETLRNGKVVVRGQGAAAAGKLAIRDQSGPYACKGLQQAGVYSYKLKGRTLTLKVVTDRCAGRKIILTTNPLRRL